MTLTLGEPVYKESPMRLAEANDHSKASGFSFSLSSDALFENAAPVVSINLALLYFTDGSAKFCIRKILSASKLRESFGFEDPHARLSLKI